MGLSQRERTLIVGGVVVVSLAAALIFKDRADRAEERAAAAIHAATHDPGPEWRRTPRPTFDLSVQELIDRYNAVQSRVDRSMLLPPVAAMEDGGSNSLFHVLRHGVQPNIDVLIEVDNAKNKPFSIGVMAAGQGPDYAVRAASTLAVLSATVFDPETGGADVLIKGCLSASKARDGRWATKVSGFDVYCTNVGGAWMAGIAAPKEL